MKSSFNLLFPALTATLLTFILIFINPSISMADGSPTSFGAWLSLLRKEALARGIPPQTLDSALQDLEPVSRVIELDRNQPESKLTFDQYLSRILSEERIAIGRKKLSDSRRLLAKIADAYGVQPRFLVALWGVETDFGRVTGSFPVIDSLVSLVYDGRRSSFFRKELFHALRILDEGHISLARMKGSWAGAMGQLQFMPSTFRHFAVDFDGDGRIDIWESQEDVFASAANYLSQSGWRRGQTWGQEVLLPEGADLALTEFKQAKSPSDWWSLGVSTLDGSNFLSPGLLSSIVQPEGLKDRAFLVYDNYHVIHKWNRSDNFALSVGLLADRIGDL
ncbi:MAG: lytic murein transglycosylase [Deltaproteobacteria bacterium]|nr:lytic murein transglycosylase [Deltaproteobacteria bacterium]